MDSERDISQDFKEVFAGDNGKRVLKELKRLSTYSKSSVRTGKPVDVNRLIYDEGQRAIILYIEKQINKDLRKARK